MFSMITESITQLPGLDKRQIMAYEPSVLIL